MFIRKNALALLCLLIPFYAWTAVIDPLDGTSTSTVTLAAPGGGKQNCLTHVSFDVSAFGANTATFRILDANTTNYQLIVSSSTGFNGGVPIVLPFTYQNPWCGGMNNAVQLKNTATTYDINYHGYIKSNN